MRSSILHGILSHSTMTILLLPIVHCRHLLIFILQTLFIIESEFYIVLHVSNQEVPNKKPGVRKVGKVA